MRSPTFKFLATSLLTTMLIGVVGITTLAEAINADHCAYNPDSSITHDQSLDIHFVDDDGDSRNGVIDDVTVNNWLVTYNGERTTDVVKKSQNVDAAGFSPHKDLGTISNPAGGNPPLKYNPLEHLDNYDRSFSLTHRITFQLRNEPPKKAVQTLKCTFTVHHNAGDGNEQSERDDGDDNNVPSIRSVDFPDTLVADGTTYQGNVHFRDRNGDITQIRLDLVRAPVNDWQDTVQWNPEVYGQTEGSIPFQVNCEGDEGVFAYEVTLIDEAGNRSDGTQFSFECVRDEANNDDDDNASRSDVEDIAQEADLITGENNRDLWRNLQQRLWANVNRETYHQACQLNPGDGEWQTLRGNLQRMEQQGDNAKFVGAVNPGKRSLPVALMRIPSGLNTSSTNSSDGFETHSHFGSTTVIAFCEPGVFGGDCHFIVLPDSFGILPPSILFPLILVFF